MHRLIPFMAAVRLFKIGWATEKYQYIYGQWYKKIQCRRD